MSRFMPISWQLYYENENSVTHRPHRSLGLDCEFDTH